MQTTQPGSLNVFTNNANLFRAYKTILEMLLDRGYDVFHELTKDLKDSGKTFRKASDWMTNENTFKTKANDLVAISLLKEKSTNGEKIYVLFFDEKIGITKVKTNIIEPMETNNIPRCIAISTNSNKITGIAEKEIQKLKPKLIIEHFYAVQLMENKSKHCLQPKFEIVSEEDKCNILSRYNIKAENCPRIATDDAMAKYFGLQPGQMLKITNFSQSAGVYVKYRICH